jgi:hypothetical protein
MQKGGSLGQGLLRPIQTVETRKAYPGPPYPRAPRLGPRPYSISLVNSFGGNFVQGPMPWIIHPTAWHPAQRTKVRGCLIQSSTVRLRITGTASWTLGDDPQTALTSEEIQIIPVPSEKESTLFKAVS